MENIHTLSCADLLNVDTFHCILFILRYKFLNHIFKKITPDLKGNVYFGDAVKLMANMTSQSSGFHAKGRGL